MRVLHISSEKSWRGGEQQIAYLIQGADHVKHFVFCRKNSPFETYCQQNNIPYVAGVFHIGGILSSANRLIQYCRSNTIDVIHCHTGKAHLLGYLAIRMGSRIPMVVSRRIATPPSQSFLTKKRYNHDLVKRIICVSEYIRKTMFAYLDNPSKAITIHSGIDTTKFKAPGFTLLEKFSLSTDTRIVGTIAALTAEKDLSTFLRAAKRVIETEENVHFFIVGGGKEEKMLTDLARRLEISSHITFTGHVDNPYDFLQQFDIFMFTSVNEGLGTSILDAFACRIPVIASKTGGIPEMVIDGETGQLVPPGNADAFANCVIKSLTHGADTAEMVKNASKLLEKFTFNHMARQTAGCYQEVLAESHSIG